jgi:hypothetical protein
MEIEKLASMAGCVLEQVYKKSLFCMGLMAEI